MYENFFDNILSAGYIPTITLPTRLSNNSTLMDNIFTNIEGNKLTGCILNIHILVITNPLFYLVTINYPP